MGGTYSSTGQGWPNKKLGVTAWKTRDHSRVALSSDAGPGYSNQRTIHIYNTSFHLRLLLCHVVFDFPAVSFPNAARSNGKAALWDTGTEHTEAVHKHGTTPVRMHTDRARWGRRSKQVRALAQCGVTPPGVHQLSPFAKASLALSDEDRIVKPE